MNIVRLGSLSAVFRLTLKTLAFAIFSFAAIFCASAAYGLFKMLFDAMSRGADIGIAELSTHSGLAVVFIMLAGLDAYLAKKCYW